MNPELQSKIQIWRQKAADGTLTLEEAQQAVQLLREGRRTAATSSETKRRVTAKAAIPSADDMLKELL